MNQKAKRFGRDSRGAVFAEAAIVLPVLLLVMSVGVELGRFFYTYNTLAKATRVSARFLSTRDLTPANIAEAKNMVVYGNVGGSGPKVLPDLDTGDVVVAPTSGFPELVTVSITGYTYAPVFALGPVRDVVSISLQPSTTMKY